MEEIIAVIASTIGKLSSLSNLGDSEERLTVATDNLLHSISTLTKYSRDCNHREEQSIKLLENFKKVSRRQKAVIEKLKEQKEEKVGYV